MATKTFFPVSAAIILLTGLAGSSIGALAASRANATSGVEVSRVNYEATITAQSTTIAQMSKSAEPEAIVATSAPLSASNAKAVAAAIAATPAPLAANNADSLTDVAAGAQVEAVEAITVPDLVEAVDGEMPIRPIGYGLTTERRGDGWVYGRVLLAFRNVTTQLGFATPINVAAHLETQEGQTYPAIVDQISKQPDRYEAVTSMLDLTASVGVPPGLAYQRIGALGGGLGEPYAVFFRYSEAGHPTRIVFADMPNWNIDLAKSSTSDFDFPAFSKAAKPISIAALRGRMIAESPGKAQMVFDGTCDISAGYFYIIRLNYTLRGMDKFQGSRLTGMMPSVAIAPATNGALIYQRRPTTFDIEVGPGETIRSALKIDTRILASSNLLQPNKPALVVLYDTQNSASASYTTVSLEGCAINKDAMQ